MKKGGRGDFLVPPQSFTLHFHEILESTNDTLHQMVISGHGHGTVVHARMQTKGRGRSGREWISPSGNLYCSILLETGSDQSKAAELTFVAGLALQSVIATMLPPERILLKWPNDILYDGQKIAGILLEAAGSLTIVGIGVNVTHSPHPSAGLLYPATSLWQEEVKISPEELLVKLCWQMDHWHQVWQKGGFPALKDDWLDRSVDIGKDISVRLPDGNGLTGRFAGLDQFGALLLEEDSGKQRRILAADVFLL